MLIAEHLHPWRGKEATFVIKVRSAETDDGARQLVYDFFELLSRTGFVSLTLTRTLTLYISTQITSTHTIPPPPQHSTSN